MYHVVFEGSEVCNFDRNRSIEAQPCDKREGFCQQSRIPCCRTRAESTSMCLRQLPTDPTSDSDSKHADIRHHFMRSLLRKVIRSLHVASKYQHADVLSEATRVGASMFHRAILMNSKYRPLSLMSTKQITILQEVTCLDQRGEIEV